MHVLTVRALAKSYRQGRAVVLSGIDFDLKPHEICAVVGASGSGKSTLLKLIAGLEHPDSGTIALNEIVVSDPQQFVPPEKRNVGFVFQDFALFPHLTVAENVGFGLGKAPKQPNRVAQLLALVGLTQHASKYPNELSGGEQQRVALARTLAPKPTLLLMDEPFSNLDVGIKKEIRRSVFEIIRQTGLSCVFVTHDMDDAMMYADTIAILHRAKFEQRGSPRVLYSQPQSAYVARLFSDINVLNPQFVRQLGIEPSPTKTYAVRTTDVQCFAEERPAAIPATVQGRIFLGSEVELDLHIAGGNKLNATMPFASAPDAQNVFVTISEDNLLVFDR